MAPPRELPETLRALADAAGNKLGKVNWPVAIINAVWDAKETPEGEDGLGQTHALDRVEAILAEVLGMEIGEALSVNEMVARLKAMRKGRQVTCPKCKTVAIVHAAGLDTGEMNFCTKCGTRLLPDDARVPIPLALVSFAEEVREKSPEYVVALSIGPGEPDWAVRVQHPTGRFDRKLIEEFSALAREYGCVGEYIHLQLAPQDIFTIWVREGDGV